MLNVFFTVDVEIWPTMWALDTADFDACFDRYIYGRTGQGDFGLPLQLEMLNRHGLKAVFMVESLFASRFGLEPLRRILDLIRDAGQEVQLHLHPEWARHGRPPLVPEERVPLGKGAAGQLCLYSPEDQRGLIAVALDNFRDCGLKTIRAFRAGSYMADADTLAMLAGHGILFDTSYNGCCRCPADLAGGAPLHHPRRFGSVTELPVTVFEEWPGRWKHLQLGASSYAELSGLLLQARRHGWRAVTIVSHGFELLNPAKTRHDPIVIQRFDRLLRFLADNKDKFRTVGFSDVEPDDVLTTDTPSALRGNVFSTAYRYAEQVWRRRYD